MAERGRLKSQLYAQSAIGGATARGLLNMHGGASTAGMHHQATCGGALFDVYGQKGASFRELEYWKPRLWPVLGNR